MFLRGPKKPQVTTEEQRKENLRKMDEAAIRGLIATKMGEASIVSAIATYEKEYGVKFNR
jgi:maltose-binding protein MalE